VSAGSTRRVSLNEVLRIARRAMLALGIGPSGDREPGEAVAWLESRGLGGVWTLAADVDALRARGAAAPAIREQAPQRLRLDAGGASGLLLAPLAVDWLAAHAAAEGAGVRRDEAVGAGVVVERLRSPLWVLPALAAAAGVGIWAQARDAAGAPVLCADRGEGGPSLMLWHPPQTLAGRCVDLELGAGSPSPAAGGAQRTLAAADLDAAHRAALERGCRVDAQRWQRLLAVAREVLVPESQQSRTRGAGGGDDDA